MRNIILLAASLISVLSMTPASAKDGPVPAAELKRIAVGRTVSNLMYYGADGRYTYNGGNPGRYKISTGRICVDFDNGGSRCDSIMKEGSTYVLINREGDRYPFEPN